MKRLRAIWWCVGVLGVAPAFAGSPDPKDLGISPEELSKARDFVRRMGSESYREREEAQAELAKMGRLARPVLAEAVVSDADPEIRFRASRLLPKANAADLQARIDTFLADTEGKFDHDLPGLKTFRKHLGGAERDKVRALYAEILKTPYNVEMFAAMDKGETEGGRAVADRRTAMWNDMQHRPFPPNGKMTPPRQPTLADIAALLFAESVIDADSIPKTNAWNGVTGMMFLQQGPSVQALNGAAAAHADAYKSIVRKWLVTRTNADELTNLTYQINPVLNKFPETLVLLRRIVTTEGVQGYAKGQALTLLLQQRGKDGAKEEIPFLKTLMKSDAMVQQIWFAKQNGPPEMHTCLMKDMALANLIGLSGGKITDYGFETPPGLIVGAGQVNFGQYAFTNDEKRAAGFMKWGWKQLKDSIDAPVKNTPAPKDAPKDGSKETPKDTPKDAPKDGTKETPKDAPKPAPLKPVPAPAVPAPAAPPAPAK